METQKKNYTAKDALQLLKDLNLTQQVRPLPAPPFFIAKVLSHIHVTNRLVICAICVSIGVMLTHLLPTCHSTSGQFKFGLVTI